VYAWKKVKHYFTSWASFWYNAVEINGEHLLQPEDLYRIGPENLLQFARIFKQGLKTLFVTFRTSYGK